MFLRNGMNCARRNRVEFIKRLRLQQTKDNASAHTMSYFFPSLVIIELCLVVCQTGGGWSVGEHSTIAFFSMSNKLKICIKFIIFVYFIHSFSFPMTIQHVVDVAVIWVIVCMNAFCFLFRFFFNAVTTQHSFTIKSNESKEYKMRKTKKQKKKYNRIHCTSHASTRTQDSKSCRVWRYARLAAMTTAEEHLYVCSNHRLFIVVIAPAIRWTQFERSAELFAN